MQALAVQAADGARSLISRRADCPHADLRSRSLAPAVFRARRLSGRRADPYRGRRCWTWYPRHRWVYDKVAVALSQGLEAAPHGIDADGLSGLLQADHNLKGMGVGSRVLRGAGRIRAH